MAKISKNLLLLISIIAVVIYFSSCEKYTFLVESLPPVDTSGTDTTNFVSYSTAVQPVFDAKCVSCHKGSRPPDLRPDNSFAALTAGGYVTLPAADSKLYKKIIAGSHVSLTNQSEKNIIYLWIGQGARDN